jgi:hypothetical protein
VREKSERADSENRMVLINTGVKDTKDTSKFLLSNQSAAFNSSISLKARGGNQKVEEKKKDRGKNS